MKKNIYKSFLVFFILSSVLLFFLSCKTSSSYTSSVIEKYSLYTKATSIEDGTSIICKRNCSVVPTSIDDTFINCDVDYSYVKEDELKQDNLYKKYFSKEQNYHTYVKIEVNEDLFDKYAINTESNYDESIGSPSDICSTATEGGIVLGYKASSNSNVWQAQKNEKDKTLAWFDLNHQTLWTNGGENSINKLNWDDAVSFCKKLNTNSYAGISNWRLPNIEEMKQAISSNIYSYNNQEGLGNLSEVFWSSTVYQDKPQISALSSYEDERSSKNYELATLCVFSLKN